MREIRIKQTTFERLKNHAEPFVDTEDSVINRALDALEHWEMQSELEDAKAVVGDPVDPRDLPDLTHTKILNASIAGQCVEKPYWGKLLRCVLVRAIKQDPSICEIREVQRAVVRGRKEGKGFSYHAEVDFSIRHLSANSACEALVTAAEKLGIGLEVTFMWRPKKQAMCPGVRARLSLSGRSTSG